MAVPTRTAASRTRLRYVPALDGLRAVAVAAVFAYHADLRWARGGFLGVDVFFVVSGYLITSLLVSEVHRRGRLDLPRFWKRRARRLLPALFALLAVSAVVVPIAVHDQAARLRGDLVSALTYVTNWRLIFQHQSYFQAAGRPPVLQHLWSLAIEEQFYLVWPIVLAGLLLWRRKPERLVVPILGAAVASSVLMAVLFDPTRDPSRVYYGTDTRFGTLLVGAALACVWAPDRLRPTVSPAARSLIEGVGAVGLLGLGWFFWRVDQFQTGLYRGGFLAVAVCSAMAVAAVAHPASKVHHALLGNRPMVAVGKRSYAIYLWHWPVMDLTRPHVDVSISGWPLIAVQGAVTLVLAELSYRLVEVPARRGDLGKAWRSLGAALGHRGRAGFGASTAAVGCLVIVVAIASGVVVGHRPVRTPHFLSSAAAAPASAAEPTPTTTTVPVGPVEAVPTTAPRHFVTAIGDSVMVGAQDAFHATLPDVYVSAAIGRLPSTAVTVVKTLRAQGKLGDEVIVHMGTNGPFLSSDLSALFKALQSVQRVVIVNIKAPRPWEAIDNDALGDAVNAHPNAVLVDWHSFGDAHPELFYGDGIHLKPEGVDQYVALIAAAL